MNRSWPILLLLLVFVVSASNALLRDAATYDEGTHLGAGFAILDRHDYRLNTDHPPLSRVWAALPVWLGDLRQPDYASPAWTGASESTGGRISASVAEQFFGFELVHGPRGDPARRDPMEVLVPARLMMLLPGLALALLVLSWARDLWGPPGGWLAMFLYCLSPSILAHTHLITTDIFAALGYTATLYAFWRHCRRPGWRWMVATGAGLGLAILSKFSALLLVPTLALLSVVWVLGAGAERGGRAARCRAAATCLAGALSIGWVCLWAGYGFRHAVSPEPGYRLDWDSAGRATRLVHDLKLAPEAALYGITAVPSGAARFSFLNGTLSHTGFWYYLPVAFLLKTPPALLVLLAWCLVVGLSKGRWRGFDGWFLGLAAAVYLIAAIASGMSIGHRHLLPLEPLLFIAAGRLAGELSATTWRKAAAGALLTGYAFSYAVATPRYLSYFNVLAGGSSGGWRYLVDSNIDWGQDLLRLRSWMRDNEVPLVHLAYFGTADPKAIGLPSRKVFSMPDFHPEEPGAFPAPGDYLAVSVTLLQGVYVNRDLQFAEGALRWRPTLIDSVEEFAARQGETRSADGTAISLADWMIARGLLTAREKEQIEEGLLYHRLDVIRERWTPVGKGGDSIFVYRVP